MPKNHINNWINLNAKVGESDSDNKFENQRQEVNAQFFDTWSSNEKVIGLKLEEVGILNQLNLVLIKQDVFKGIGFRVLDHINSYMLNLPESRGTLRS